MRLAKRNAWKLRAERIESLAPWSVRVQVAVMDWLSDLDDRVRRAVGP